MKIGKRIKKNFGNVNEVGTVWFVETEEHVVMMITSYDKRITHKQVNAVLNNYPLGHWIFIESRVEPGKTNYRFRNIERVLDFDVMVSVYRVDKDVALQKLLEAENK
jgi:hypothetical protein